MADRMMRMAGRGEDGKAKSLSVNNNGDIYVSNKSEVLVDETITVTLAGWHVFGGTSGRAHQHILDVSNYKNILVVVDWSDVPPGSVSIYLTSESNRVMTGASLTSEPSILHRTKTEWLSAGSESKRVFSNANYPILDMPKIGLYVGFGSVPPGSKIRCRILGGN